MMDFTTPGLARECLDCGHDRAMHERGQALGVCSQIGCSCVAFTVQLAQRKLYLGEKVGDLWVVVEERILFRQHRGWEDEPGEDEPEEDESP